MRRLLSAFMFTLAVLPVSVQADGVLDFDMRPLLGAEAVNLEEAYGGKVILVVNTASECGFTPQYEGLQKLYDRYKDRGFVVLGFPSNDFRQEPGTEKDIAEFCRINYGVEFPMFRKLSVRGANAHPFYRHLAEIAGQAPRWNFHKYLIDRAGKVVAAYGSRVAPEDARLVGRIESIL